MRISHTLRGRALVATAVIAISVAAGNHSAGETPKSAPKGAVKPKVAAKEIPLFEDPSKTVKAITKLGLSNLTPQSPAWSESMENWWAGAFSVVAFKGTGSGQVLDVDNPVMCTITSDRKERIDQVEWECRVFNLRGEAETVAKFKQLCAAFLPELGCPPPGILDKIKTPAGGRIETPEAIFELKRENLAAQGSYSWRLIIKAKRGSEVRKN